METSAGATPDAADAAAGADPGPEIQNPAQKRRRKGGRLSGVGQRAGVVAPEHIVDLGTLPSSSPLQDVALQGKGQVGLQLQVFVGQKAFVVNKTDKEINIPVGMLLCGFIKWEV